MEQELVEATGCSCTKQAKCSRNPGAGCRKHPCGDSSCYFHTKVLIKRARVENQECIKHAMHKVGHCVEFGYCLSCPCLEPSCSAAHEMEETPREFDFTRDGRGPQGGNLIFQEEVLSWICPNISQFADFLGIRDEMPDFLDGKPDALTSAQLIAAEDT